MKTDFSDWLIVSDVDGTLNTKLRMLPERNLKAITHFVEDLGGNFTLASGRNISSLRKHYERLPIKSTPARSVRTASLRSSLWAARRNTAVSVSAKWKFGRWKRTARHTPCRNCSRSSPTTFRAERRYTNKSSRATVRCRRVRRSRSMS